MYLIQYTAFLVLLFHQCIVNGFNIYDIDNGFSYFNEKINHLDSPLVSDESIKMRWILQEVDHLNSSDKRKWHMKYYEELKYRRENGPIYLFLEVLSVPKTHMWLKQGIMKELAEETQGAMYCVDHRYYGDNNPFINIDTENIKYLSSRQALADTAKLIIYLKSLPMYKDSKVVVIGGTYIHGGNLAAWMKVLYPNLIDAAISSSAPVLAKKDFYEFLQKVKDDYERYGGTGCMNNITERFENYNLLLQSPEGINKLKIDENICDECDMTVLENQQLFFFGKIFPFMAISTYGSPNLIQFHCENLKNFTDYRSFLIQHSRLYNSKNAVCICYNFHNIVNILKQERNSNFIYPWLYQSCTEFGHFPTTTSKNQPFLNLPLEFYIKICTGLFGNNYNEKKIDEGVEMSNKLYGGLKPNVTKVVFTNGDMDPWSTISVLKDLSGDAPAVVIPEAFHAQDLYSDADEDTDAVKKARKYVKNLIKKWTGK